MLYLSFSSCYHSFHLSQLLLSLPSSFCLHYPVTLLYFFSFPGYPTSKKRVSPFLGSLSASLSSTSLLFPFTPQYFSSMPLLHFSFTRKKQGHHSTSLLIQSAICLATLLFIICYLLSKQILHCCQLTSSLFCLSKSLLNWISQFLSFAPSSLLLFHKIILLQSLYMIFFFSFFKPLYFITIHFLDHVGSVHLFLDYYFPFYLIIFFTHISLLFPLYMTYLYI